MRKDISMIFGVFAAVAIIGILSIMSARQFGNATQRANVIADKSNASNLSNAIQQAILMSGKAPVASEKVEITLTNACGYDILPYVSSIPQVRAVSNGTWVAEITSSGLVKVYVKYDGKYCQLQPSESDADNYPDINSFKF